MNKEYISKLVCPVCKGPLIQNNTTSLFCENCPHNWQLLLNGIPVFIGKNIQNFWDEVTKKREHIYNKPLQTNDYYCKFVDNNWKTMLDLGCGDAVSSAPLYDRVKDIYCADTSPVALERVLKRNLDNLYPILASGYQLPFPNNFFDGIFSIFVVEHIRNPEKMLNEIHRILKPNGQLIISTDSKYYYKYFRFPLGWVKGNFNIRKNDPTHVNLMTPKQMRYLLKKTNFKITVDDSCFFLRKSVRKKIPKFLSDTFLSMTIIYKCVSI